MTLGERIQSARKKAGLTQQDLATKIGAATITIRQYELGKRNPNFKQLKKIAVALDTSIAELLDIFSGESLNYWEDEDGNEYMIPMEHIEKDDSIEKELHQRMDNAFLKLNIAGKKRVVENAEDFAKIPEYQKKDSEK